MNADMKAMRWAMVTVLALGCQLGHSGETKMDAGAFTLDHGGIIRGDKTKKRIALIFTGGDFGEGTGHVLDTLKKMGIKCGLFVTGDYVRKAEHQPLLKRAVAEGHYVGPHSDKHPLYCPWEDRKKTLVTEEEFKADLRKNIEDLKGFGAMASGPVYFIPPYEWYNEDQVRWSREMGVVLFNFTPGSGSNRDYMPESEKRFVSSQRIMEDILTYEQKDPSGLNGFFLLLHVGADRKDKMFLLLEPLVKELKERGYEFVRVDEMLEGAK
jgi:peptidoglycan/xylan/chitin deacetylase (PgdA/CDA1 family)